MHSNISEMIGEEHMVAQVQLEEALTTAENTALHSDGTTKFGHKYVSYQVGTTTDTYTLGL